MQLAQEGFIIVRMWKKLGVAAIALWIFTAGLFVGQWRASEQKTTVTLPAAAQPVKTANPYSLECQKARDDSEKLRIAIYSSINRGGNPAALQVELDKANEDIHKYCD